MKYPYSNPNLRFVDVFCALLISQHTAEQRIKDYFAWLTGKKHILLTNSCRSALYLAYKALGTHGQVITSPLTCKVAIDPITETDNTPVFADI
ncbi:MAG: DegT/DnrJ/EryC1/StrS family aminotransferase, partial [Thermodesulfobacteriota bacterium]